MGYLVTQGPCPNCTNLKALKRTHEKTGYTLLICQGCGLHLFAERRTIVLDSYIDESTIGKPVNIFSKDLFDPLKDTGVIAKESILYG